MSEPCKFLDGFPCYLMSNEGKKSSKLFHSSSDYRKYFQLIKKYKLELNVQLFAFCFLPQKVYLILQPRQFKDASAFLRLANQSYAMYFNTRYGCRGPLWNGGCKTTVIHNDQILIDCIRWIEEVPVKLNLSFSPVSYPWSSCSYRIAEQKSGLLDTRTQHKTIR